MKKTFLLILVALMTIPTFAQHENRHAPRRYNRISAERYYGLRLGLNIASLSSDVVEMDMDSRTGLSFGGVIGFQLSNTTPLWLETGLLYSEKGGESHLNDEKVTCRLIYLQVPIVCKYSFNVYDNLYIQPFLGGYFSLGVGGRTKEYATRQSSDSFTSLNRFDGGLRVGCGAEYQMVYAELGFDFGLTNIGKGDFESVHTRNFFINVGVNF